MIEKLDATVVIPAYNEEKVIVDVITKLKLIGEGLEILIVDDGSTDNTYDLAKKTGVKVIRHPYNKGYGGALKTGVRNAETDIVLFMDADGQHNPNDISKLIQHIEEYDMVVGARAKGSKIPFFRRPGKMILGFTANYLAGMKIPDLNSGLRAVKKEIVMEFMYILPNTFSFTTTLTLACIKSGYDIKYVPIKSVERVGKSKINPFRDGFRFLLLILRTIVLFDPLKVFLPMSVILFSIGSLYMAHEIIYYLNIPDGALLLIVSSIMIFFFGLLADQISFLRRGGR